MQIIGAKVMHKMLMKLTPGLLNSSIFKKKSKRVREYAIVIVIDNIIEIETVLRL